MNRRVRRAVVVLFGSKIQIHHDDTTITTPDKSESAFKKVDSEFFLISWFLGFLIHRSYLRPFASIPGSKNRRQAI